jgi:hypothetical protein
MAGRHVKIWPRQRELRGYGMQSIDHRGARTLE